MGPDIPGPNRICANHDVHSPEVANIRELTDNFKVKDWQEDGYYPNKQKMKDKGLPQVLKFFYRSISLLLIILLAGFGSLWNPPSANATSSDQSIQNAEETLAQSQNALEVAQARLDEISAEFDSLSDEVNELQNEIDELAVQVLNAQSAMLTGRQLLSNTVIYDYRNNSMSAFLGVLLGSSDWNSFTRNVDYVNQIVNQQAAEIEEQKQLRDQFVAASDQLTAQKDEQERKITELNQKREEASAVVEEAATEVESNSTELEDLRKQAQTFIWKSKTPQVEEVSDATTVDRTPVVSPNTPVIPDSTVTNDKPAQSASSSASSNSSSSDSSNDGWKSGVASAYGGSSDPNTPNPGKTATGAVCNDSSMGVAVPMSLPNFRSYYGRTVEIKYNGMTVYATVNDCGSMGGGSRALDLQPGVFKAFGYSNCYEWGLRTVSYRFL